MNIFAKFQRSTTTHDKCGKPNKVSYHCRLKSVVDEGCLTWEAAVAVEMAAVVAAAAIVTMTPVAGLVVWVVVSAVVAAAVVVVASGAAEVVVIIIIIGTK